MTTTIELFAKLMGLASILPSKNSNLCVEAANRLRELDKPDCTLEMDFNAGACYTGCGKEVDDVAQAMQYFNPTVQDLAAKL